MDNTRLETLKNLLAQNPSDSFIRYGLANEYGRSGDLPGAVAEYESLLAENPDYHAAYFHGGQTLEKLGRIDEAREYYRRGVAVTTRLGNQHALSEMQAALDILGD